MKEFDKKVIECKYDASSKRWIFLRVRTDKNMPNHISTANAVMRGILNPLSKESLLQYIRAWAKHDPPLRHDAQRPPDKRPFPDTRSNHVGERPMKLMKPADEPRIY